MGLQRLGVNYDMRKQQQQAQALQDIQMSGEKEMIDYSKAADLKMWKDTSYPAQMALMKQANLNPALMYGGAGSGGTTGGGAPSVGGQSAQSPDTAKASIQGMGLMNVAQLGLIEAQKRNIDAQTTGQEIDNRNKDKGGIDYSFKENQIANLIQTTKNETVKYDLLGLDRDIRTIEKRIAEATETNKVILSDQEVEKLTAEAEEATARAGIASNTKDLVIQEIKYRVAGAYLDNILKEKNISLTEQQIAAIKQEIAQNPEYLDIAKRDVAAKELAVKNQMELGIAHEIINGVATAIGVGALGKLFGKSRTVVEGFKRKY